MRRYLFSFNYFNLLIGCVVFCSFQVSCAQTRLIQFNIEEYGAVNDGKTISTSAIQSAIDAAEKSGGGKVTIPKGRFVSGSIILKNGVNLHVEKGAVLLGSIDSREYIRLKRWNSFILADGQKNISITGEGEINGRGRQVALHLDSLFHAGLVDSARYNFVEMRPIYSRRPQLIEFVSCENILVRDITLKNAACWVQTHDRCKNIIIDNVHTDSDAYWNNDGIDISDCQNVRITNCFINSADDGICIKSHKENFICDSIYISDCTVRSSASAIKFGTRSHGGFKNVVVERIKVYDTFRSAIAVESVDGGILEDILIQDVEAVNTGNAIFIRLGHRTQKNPVGNLKNVTIRNVKVDVAFERPDYKYDIRGPALPFFHNVFPSSIVGIPDYPIENLLLENIEINFPGGGTRGLANMPIYRINDVPEKISAYPEFSMFGELPAWGFYVRHVQGLTLKNIRLNLGKKDYRPAFVFDDVNGLEIKELKINGEEKPHKLIFNNVENVGGHFDPTWIFKLN